MNPTQIQSNPLLRNYSAGLPTQFRTELTRFICPRVPVFDRSGQYVVFDDENYHDVIDTTRAIGTDGKFINEGAKLETYALTDRALNGTIDKKIEGMAASVAVNMVQRRMNSIVQATERETHDRVIKAIAAHATNAGTIAASTDTTDVIEKLDEIIEAFALANGIENLNDIRMVFGTEASRLVKHNATVKARKTGGGEALAAPSLQEVAGFLDMTPQVMKSTIMQRSSAKGKTKQLEYVDKNKIHLFIARENATDEDNTFIKQFYLNEGWMNLRSWPAGSQRFINVGMDYVDQVVVTNPKGCQTITIS